MEKNYDDFVQLFRKELPKVQFIEFHARSLETLKWIMVTITDLGVFQSLWKIFELWLNKHNNASIKVSYKSIEGKLIEITYNSLNKKEVEDILSRNPPVLDSKTKIILNEELPI